MQRDLEMMMKLHFQKKIEKYYGQLFRLAIESESCPKEID